MTHAVPPEKKVRCPLHSQGILKVISKHKDPRVLLFLSL